MSFEITVKSLLDNLVRFCIGSHRYTKWVQNQIVIYLFVLWSGVFRWVFLRIVIYHEHRVKHFIDYPINNHFQRLSHTVWQVSENGTTIPPLGLLSPFDIYSVINWPFQLNICTVTSGQEKTPIYITFIIIKIPSWSRASSSLLGPESLCNKIIISIQRRSLFYMLYYLWAWFIEEVKMIWVNNKKRLNILSTWILNFLPFCIWKPWWPAPPILTHSGSFISWIVIIRIRRQISRSKYLSPLLLCEKKIQ